MSRSAAMWRGAVKPIQFWMYVMAGVALIIGSAISLPFVSLRRR